MTNKPNSGAEILDNLQGVMSDAQMGRGDLTYIGAPKSKKRERDLSAYTAVADLIAEQDALREVLAASQVLILEWDRPGEHYLNCLPGQDWAKAEVRFRNAIDAARTTTPTQDKSHD